MTRLDWPTGFDRTDAARRSKNRSFEASIADTTKAIETELGGVREEDMP